MKLAKLLLGGCVLSLGVAAFAASSHKITIIDPTWVGQTELKPGSYNVQVTGDKAMLKMGKQVVEVPAKMETNSSKFSYTQLGTKSINGKAQLQEIDLGGTNSKIVFGEASGPAAGTN
ncbi:MAG TPA: hypothetical protein VMB25_22620 [Bryobacteraceae bacterium]|nr:hypothetical protein [Bryobacteraceae bacterium]